MAEEEALLGSDAEMLGGSSDSFDSQDHDVGGYLLHCCVHWCSHFVLVVSSPQQAGQWLPAPLTLIGLLAMDVGKGLPHWAASPATLFACGARQHPTCHVSLPTLCRRHERQRGRGGRG